MVTADRVGDPQARPFGSRLPGMDDIEPRIAGRTGLRFQTSCGYFAEMR
jgi:hypothetical protein